MSGAAWAQAQVIAVGSELLGTSRLDTNSLFIADRLGSLGITLRCKMVVGDDKVALADAIRDALRRVDLLLLTGGLGPTDDDITRETVAEVLSLPLDEDSGILQRIGERFAKRGLRMPEVNRRQAMVPRGAQVLPNPYGTAPGLLIDHAAGAIVLLPGPPRELKPMLDVLVAGPFARRAGAVRVHRATLFIAGRTESHVEEAAQPIYSRWRASDPPIETTILATPGQIELHLTLRSADPQTAGRVLDGARNELAQALGEDVFSTDGKGMEEVVGDLLRERSLTVAVAESCTGGLLMSRLTDVPGSSAYVLGGAVPYSNELKTTMAGVPAALIAAHGAVSEPVAAALADGIRQRTGAHIGIGITGIAGPSGGTTQKPVGTVAIAALLPDRGAQVRTVLLPGGRGQIRFNATQTALDLVRRALTFDR